MNSTPSIPQTCCFTVAVHILSALYYRCRRSRSSTSLPHILSETSTSKTYVIGVLGTTETGALQDRCMAAEFAALGELFSHIRGAVWLAPSDWTNDSWKPIVGDPHAEHLEIMTPTPIDMSCIKSQFIIALARASAVAQKHDTIVVVLCGHGDEETGDLVIGGRGDPRMVDPLKKTDLEVCLEMSKVPAHRTFLLSPACYSDLWRSEHWTLFAAAEHEEVSASMTTNTHGLTAPHPVRRVYLRPFGKEHLDRVPVVGPTMAVGAVHSNDSSPTFLPLSADERRSLLVMATAHHKMGYPNVGKSITVNALAREVARGGVISDFDERYLLECLLYRTRECQRAAVIARELGWDSKDLEPPEKWCRANGLRMMRAAEARGAAIATEFFLGPEVGAKWWVPHTKARYRRYKSMAPGAWLAHAWESAGSPVVSEGDWATAVATACAEVEQ
ncbi:hypothetical protein C8R45DRAFT_1105301 [Mycena sanguinolenta]|nr:hypothetical protein C8R45DRAFT_1105301 [Mycena sanguinolenta]